MSLKLLGSIELQSTKMYSLSRSTKSSRTEMTFSFFNAKTFLSPQDDTIDFLEYVAALNLVLRGKLVHKLRWTFKIYDKDGNGCIDKPELLEIVEVSRNVLLIFPPNSIDSIW